MSAADAKTGKRGQTPFDKARAKDGKRGQTPFDKTPSAKTQVKLCGMFRHEDIEAVNQVRPDFVGFVVDFPRSHRSVTVKQLADLSPRVAQGIKCVGVFVNEPVEVLASLYEQGLIHVAQLHGNEDERYLESLRAACSVPTIQAFKVRTAQDVARAQASTANLVLLDNGQGTGEAFDWSLLEGVGRPFMLAGGLGPHNVAEAIAAVRPWGVDMSSGIETCGLKDPTKMAAAVAAVRGKQRGYSPLLAHKEGAL